MHWYKLSQGSVVTGVSQPIMRSFHQGHPNALDAAIHCWSLTPMRTILGPHVISDEHLALYIACFIGDQSRSVAKSVVARRFRWLRSSLCAVCSTSYSPRCFVHRMPQDWSWSSAVVANQLCTACQDDRDSVMELCACQHCRLTLLVPDEHSIDCIYSAWSD